MNYLKNKYAMSVMGILAIALYVTGRFWQETTSVDSLAKIACFGLAALMYLFCLTNVTDPDLKRQLTVINILILIFHILMDLCVLKMVIMIRYYSEICMLLAWTIIPAAILIRDYLKNRQCFAQIGGFFKRYRALLTGCLIITAVVVIFAYDKDGPHFVWDPNLAYNLVLRDIDSMSLFTPLDMIFSGHLSYSYFYPISIFYLLTGSVELAFFIYNAFCILTVIIGSAFIFRSLFPKHSTATILTATAVCAVSPCIFSYSTLYNEDFAAICMAPILLLVAYKRKWGYFIFLGFITVFIKEPGVYYFAAVCATVLFWEFFAEKRKTTVLIKDTKYWFMLSFGALFGILYFVVGNYLSAAPEEEFGISVQHIWDIIRVFCVLNFSWILVILAIALAVSTFILHKDKLDTEYKRAIMIIGLADMAHLVMNMIVKSFATPRYREFYISNLLVLAMIFLLTIERKSLRTACFGILAALLLVSNFATIDPLSLALMEKVDIGETKLLSSDSGTGFSDELVYNRQYYGFDLAVSEVMAKAVENGDMIVMSTGRYHSNWGISGKWMFDDKDGIYDYEELWDIKRNERAPGYTPVYDEEKYMPIQVKYVYPDQDPAEVIPKGVRFMYIYGPTINDGLEDTLRAACTDTEEGFAVNRGWTISYIRGIL